MGRLPGHRQVTFYVDPELYEVIRCSAYTLGENIYDFVDEALRAAFERRMSKPQQATIRSMAEQNIRNGRNGRNRRRQSDKR